MYAKTKNRTFCCRPIHVDWIGYKRFNKSGMRHNFHIGEVLSMHSEIRDRAVGSSEFNNSLHRIFVERKRSLAGVVSGGSMHCVYPSR